MLMRTNQRAGAAVVELALLLPLIVFLFVIGVDFARVFFHHITVTNAARSGAMYGAQDPTQAQDTIGIRDAALADAKDLSPAPEVKSAVGTDELGNPCINVTVNWTFQTASSFPIVPNTVNLSRTVQMRIAPKQPKEIFE
jgi:Flp pilus assembly protein TadG